ncbi:uncharacterized protein LOC100178656 [Ciona intestinalis]
MEEYCSMDYKDYDETFEALELPSTYTYGNALLEWKKKYGDLIMDDDATEDDDLDLSTLSASIDRDFSSVSSSSGKRNIDKERETTRQRRELYSRLDAMDDVVDKLEIEASASFALQDRIRMTQGTLSRLEMRQEKITREAIYENVTSQCHIRQLEDEVIQLRMREARHQADIQHLMAENSRLKLQMMKIQPWSNISDPNRELRMTSQTKTNFVKSKSSGLMDVDQLIKPICDGIMQRGALPRCVISSQQALVKAPTVPTKCPLCGHQSKPESRRDVTTRSVSTSTMDLQNIVALQSTVCVMGIFLPIPLVLSCFMTSLDESISNISRVCFASMMPSDPHLADMQAQVIKALGSMRCRILMHNYPQRSKSLI